MNGKVAVITSTPAINEEEYRSAQIIMATHSDKVIHITWPNNFIAEQEQMRVTLEKLAFNHEIKALVLNQAVHGTNAAVDKLLETRKDIFIAYGSPHENVADIATRAHLVVMFDEVGMGNQIPLQAKKMGAKTLVHYSFPRHMAVTRFVNRRDLIKVKCAEIGLEFVDATVPDPVGPGFPSTVRFIMEDVPKLVAKYGKDTAFFSTNCKTQIPLIKAVINAGAIYPLQCCPSPYHGFVSALGIKSDLENPDNLQHVIEETRRLFKEKGLEGRFSTWPVPSAMMFTVGFTEYAIKVIDGEISADNVDAGVLKKCFSKYAEPEVAMRPYIDKTGKEYPNFLMVLMEPFIY